jgi:hypothetical protein
VQRHRVLAIDGSQQQCLFNATAIAACVTLPELRALLEQTVRQCSADVLAQIGVLSAAEAGSDPASTDARQRYLTKLNSLTWGTDVDMELIAVAFKGRYRFVVHDPDGAVAVACFPVLQCVADLPAATEEITLLHGSYRGHGRRNHYDLVQWVADDGAVSNTLPIDPAETPQLRLERWQSISPSLLLHNATAQEAARRRITDDATIAAQLQRGSSGGSRHFASPPRAAAAALAGPSRGPLLRHASLLTLPSRLKDTTASNPTPRSGSKPSRPPLRHQSTTSAGAAAAGSASVPSPWLQLPQAHTRAARKSVVKIIKQKSK